MTGDPLPPTIFNVVVGAVIRYWVAVVVPTEDSTERLGLLIQYLMVYLYADYGLVASTQMEILQRVFEILAILFNQVRLQTSMRNTVSMACHTCHAPSQM